MNTLSGIKQWMLRVFMQTLCAKNRSVPDCPTNPHTIVLWQFGGMGDMILISGVIDALRKAWPNAQVHIWCSHPQFAVFLKHFPNVKMVQLFDVYSFDSRTLLHANIREKLRVIRNAMCELDPDVVINLHWPAMLDWWAVEWWLIAQMDAPYTIGFGPDFIDRCSLLTTSLNVSAAGSDHYTGLYSRLLSKSGLVCDNITRFPLITQHIDQARQLLAAKTMKNRPCICLHIGGRRLKMENKMWPIDRFALLADRLMNQGISLVLIGASDEIDMGEELCNQVAGCVNLIGQTELETMAALIAQVDGFIGHDSGPFHIAVSVNTPAVAICGRPDAEPEYLNYDFHHDCIEVITGFSPEKISVTDVYDSILRVASLL